MVQTFLPTSPGCLPRRKPGLRRMHRQSMERWMTRVRNFRGSWADVGTIASFWPTETGRFRPIAVNALQWPAQFRMHPGSQPYNHPDSVLRILAAMRTTFLPPRRFSAENAKIWDFPEIWPRRRDLLPTSAKKFTHHTARERRSSGPAEAQFRRGIREIDWPG